MEYAHFFLLGRQQYAHLYKNPEDKNIDVVIGFMASAE
jgi:hypothetical protein